MNADDIARWMPVVLELESLDLDERMREPRGLQLVSELGERPELSLNRLESDDSILNVYDTEFDQWFEPFFRLRELFEIFDEHFDLLNQSSEEDYEIYGRFDQWYSCRLENVLSKDPVECKESYEVDFNGFSQADLDEWERESRELEKEGEDANDVEGGQKP